MGEWQLVPKEPTREMLDAMPTLPAINLPVPDIERGLMPSQVQNRTRYLAALAAAPKMEIETIRAELQAVIDEIGGEVPDIVRGSVLDDLAKYVIKKMGAA